MHSYRERRSARPAAVFALFLVAALISPRALHAADEDVLFQSDFRASDWSVEWGHTEKLPNTALVRKEGNNGFQPFDGPALQVRVQEGEHWGLGKLAFYPRTVLGEDPDELYFRYYVRFGTDWEPATNGKLPGFGGTYGKAGWGGKPSDGYNGWSARSNFKPLDDGRIAIGSYVYHADMSGMYGSSWSWTEGEVEPLERNRWYCIEQYVKLNAPGARNGVLRGWIDGEPVFERTGIRFRELDSLGIEKVWMNVYHGGKTPAPRDLSLYVDDVVVSSSYVGPRHIQRRPRKPVGLALSLK